MKNCKYCNSEIEESGNCSQCGAPQGIEPNNYEILYNKKLEEKQSFKKTVINRIEMSSPVSLLEDNKPKLDESIATILALFYVCSIVGIIIGFLGTLTELMFPNGNIGMYITSLIISVIVFTFCYIIFDHHDTTGD